MPSTLSAVDLYLNRLAAPGMCGGGSAAGARRSPPSGRAPAARSSGRSSNHAIPDVTTYSILCRVGRVDVWIERDEAHCDLESTITDILSGQVENVVRVSARNEAEGWSAVVTEDIAIEIAERIGRRGDGAAVEAPLLEFIADHAGADYARGLRVREDVFAGE